MSTPALELHQVAFAYDRTPVLRGVSMSVPENAFLAIIGPNGGGKSTLLKLCLDLLQPASGEIRVCGVPPAQGKRLVGYVPQDTNVNKDFPVSVLDVVLMGRVQRTGWWRGYTADDQAAARLAMEQLGIWGYRTQRIGQLSGGERQRAFIARALVTRPRILMLDEPTANLDARGQGELFELLRKLASEMTVIMVTHDVGVVSRYVTAVACVNQCLHYHATGQIDDLTLAEVYGHPLEVLAHDHLPRRHLPVHDHAEHG